MDTLLNQYVKVGTVYGKVVNVSNNGRVVFIMTGDTKQRYYQALARNCTPCEIPNERHP